MTESTPMYQQGTSEGYAIEALRAALQEIINFDPRDVRANLARKALNGSWSPVETSEHPDTVRLRWLANTVLFCDYGDNSHPDKLIGWRVFEFNAPLAYGPSINDAIDAARKQEKGQPRKRPSSAQETPREPTASEAASFDKALARSPRRVEPSAFEQTSAPIDWPAEKAATEIEQ